MATGVDPGVESGERVARAVTARAVMPNQGRPAARRAVRGVGADELNRHGKRGVDRGGRMQAADGLTHPHAYLNLRGAKAWSASACSTRGHLAARPVPPASARHRETR